MPRPTSGRNWSSGCSTRSTISALIEDLIDRGMLEKTLVVTMGEFGRTPQINKNAGRDHWPKVLSAALAGGGIQCGYVYGKTNNKAVILFCLHGGMPHYDLFDPKPNAPID